MQTIYSDLLGADNSSRQRAEEQMNEQSTKDPNSLADNLIEGMKTAEVNVASLCLVLMKKYFLDFRATTTLTDA
jgi:hypothetical protein